MNTIDEVLQARDVAHVFENAIFEIMIIRKESILGNGMSISVLSTALDLEKSSYCSCCYPHILLQIYAGKILL